MQASSVNKDITIGVVGLGCIGGSIAMALTQTGYSVVGVDIKEDVIKQCLEHGHIQKGGTSYNILTECQVIFIATPLNITSKVIKDVFAAVGRNAVITDTSSVKEYIINNLPEGIRFVGGHPMAGSEQAGLSAARPFLFKNAYYILTKERAPQEDYFLVSYLIEQMGAIVIDLDAATHDRSLAKVSHLPHMVAYALVNSALKCNISATIAAGGFRDITRIAASDPSLWVSVAQFNKDNLIKEMDNFIEEFVVLRQAIAYENFEFLAKTLEKGRKKRESIDPYKGSGIYKITMDIKDEPGIIGRITTLLGENGINLRNIGIEYSRADGSGALVIEFYSGEDHQRAKNILGAIAAEGKA